MTIDAMIDGILDREGGYVNHPSDPGGATNWGITQRVAKANGYHGHMRDLPKATARDIYRREYIEKPGFLGICEIDPVVAEEVIDSGVNAGQGRAAKWYQTALNLFNRRGKDYADILVDGDIGRGTLAAHRALIAKRGAKDARDMMIDALDGLQFGHYASLSSDNSKFEDFMPGWVRTRIGNTRA
jgi:lysozyme family protein